MYQNTFDYKSVETVERGLSPSWSVINPSCLFSIGYEGKSIGKFIDCIINNTVMALVDVRFNPISRKPGFSKAALRYHLERNGINYYHIPQLGIPSQLRKDLGSRESYSRLFNYYDSNILPSNSMSILKIKGLLDQYQRVVLMCFEADFQSCHRHRITNHLNLDPTFNLEIIHL